jgi:hypothetical protein
MIYEQIINFVILKENQNREDVFGSSRKPEFCETRYIIWKLGRKFTLLTFGKLGVPFDRGHSDVLLGINRFDDRMFTEPKIAEKYQFYEVYFKKVLKIENELHVFKPYQPGKMSWMRNRPVTLNHSKLA